MEADLMRSLQQLQPFQHAAVPGTPALLPASWWPAATGESALLRSSLAGLGWTHCNPPSHSLYLVQMHCNKVTQQGKPDTSTCLRKTVKNSAPYTVGAHWTAELCCLDYLKRGMRDRGGAGFPYTGQGHLRPVGLASDTVQRAAHCCS